MANYIPSQTDSVSAAAARITQFVLIHVGMFIIGIGIHKNYYKPYIWHTYRYDNDTSKYL